MFLDAGIQPVHENCMNYGGLGWTFALRLVEAVEEREVALLGDHDLAVGVGDVAPVEDHCAGRRLGRPADGAHRVLKVEVAAVAAQPGEPRGRLRLHLPARK